MRRVVCATLALAFVLSIIGCATLPLESKLDKPVSMTKLKNNSSGRFVSQNKAFWLFWGLVPLSIPQVDAVVGPQVASHTGAQNLKIVKEHNVLDIIVTALTNGILYMETVTIEGEVFD